MKAYNSGDRKKSIILSWQYKGVVTIWYNTIPREIMNRGRKRNLVIFTLCMKWSVRWNYFILNNLKKNHFIHFISISISFFSVIKKRQNTFFIWRASRLTNVWLLFNNILLFVCLFFCIKVKHIAAKEKWQVLLVHMTSLHCTKIKYLQKCIHLTSQIPTKHSSNTHILRKPKQLRLYNGRFEYLISACIWELITIMKQQLALN